MKAICAILFCLSALLAASAPAHAQDTDIVEKTYCAQAIGFLSLDDLKLTLEDNAKRMAAEEFFSELIAARTSVENFVVTSDQIQSSSLGLIRMSGSTTYANGSNLAEVCATINAYVTAADRAQFDPVDITKRLCLANADLSAEALTKLVKKEAIVQALYDYDVRLEGQDPERLAGLMREITYIESDFLTGTSTYCVTVEGKVTPVEVLAFGLAEAAPGVIVATVKTSTPEATQTPEAAAEDGVVSLADRYVPDCTTELEFGQYVRCSITTEGEEQRYTFITEVDDKFRVGVDRVDGDLLPTLRIVDNTGREPNNTGTGVGCHDSGTSSFWSPVCIANRSGLHTIVVGNSESGTAGTYRLTVQSLMSPGYATPIDFGTIVTGELAENWQTDYYTFEAERDDRFVVRVNRVDGDLSPQLSVWDKTGNQPNNTGLGVGCYASNSRVAETPVCIASRSGRYTVVVGTSESDTAGTYTIVVQKQN